jgi:hypothetical protein
MPGSAASHAADGDKLQSMVPHAAERLWFGVILAEICCVHELCIEDHQGRTGGLS